MNDSPEEEFNHVGFFNLCDSYRAESQVCVLWGRKHVLSVKNLGFCLHSGSGPEVVKNYYCTCQQFCFDISLTVAGQKWLKTFFCGRRWHRLLCYVSDLIRFLCRRREGAGWRESLIIPTKWQIGQGRDADGKTSRDENKTYKQKSKKRRSKERRELERKVKERKEKSELERKRKERKMEGRGEEWNERRRKEKEQKLE